MDPLTWTGALGAFFVPVIQIAFIALVIGLIGSFVAVFATSTQPVFAPGGAVISPPSTGSSPPAFRIARSVARVIWISCICSAASRGVT